MELPELVKAHGGEETVLTLDVIKRNVAAKRYKRLDRFQEDVFSVLNAARELSRSDSQMFEDAGELQMSYMRARDSLCKNGEVFTSPALDFADRCVCPCFIINWRHAHANTDALRKTKAAAEKVEDATAVVDPKRRPSVAVDGDEGLKQYAVDNVLYS